MDIAVDKCTLNDILGLAGTQYRVPYYQRGYSWELEHVDELIDDIDAALGTSYFLGSIVLTNENRMQPEVIDGQQRVATLMMLLCAIRDRYKAIGHSDDAYLIHTTYVQQKTIGKEPFYKLVLGEADADFFRDYVLRKLDDPERKGITEYKKSFKGLRESNKRIWRAWLRINEHLDERLKQLSDLAASIDFLGKLSEQIVQDLSLIRIGVGTASQAFVIFETLNDRGLSLSAADLLKNHLFAKASKQATIEESVQQLSRRWEDVVETLSNVDITTFLRHFWLSKIKLVRTDELFDQFKEYLESRRPMQLVEELEEYAGYYATFVDPRKEDDADIRRTLDGLRTLRATLCYSLLLSARKVLDNVGFLRVARVAEVITFRYSTICNKTARDLERLYHEAGKILFEGGGRNLEDVIRLLKAIIPGDAEFRAVFMGRTMTRMREQTGYLLRRVEEHFGTKEKVALDSGKVWLEHIMPQTLSEAWKSYLGSDAEKHEEYLHRLGNITLLGRKLDIQASNRPFVDKKVAYYDKSEFRITRELVAIDRWDCTAIDKRQEQLAELACHVWDAAII